MATGVDTSTAQAVEEWARFLGALRRARARIAQDPDARLTLAQYTFVAPLLAAPTLSVGELAAAAGVASPTATRMLDGLEREGVVAREAAAGDRRCVALRLTRPGRGVVEAERTRLEAKRDELFAGLDPEEREQAGRLLARLSDLMEEL